MAAHGDGHGAVASVPAAGCVGGLHLHLRGDSGHGRTAPATSRVRSPGCGWTGSPIDPATSYSVTVNSFLASGGDNFRAFANGTGKADSGRSTCRRWSTTWTRTPARTRCRSTTASVRSRSSSNVARELHRGRERGVRRRVVDHVGPRRRQGHRDPGQARRRGARHRDAGQHHRHRRLRPVRHRRTSTSSSRTARPPEPLDADPGRRQHRHRDPGGRSPSARRPRR